MSWRDWPTRGRKQLGSQVPGGGLCACVLGGVGRARGVTLKLWLGLRDADMEVLVEEVPEVVVTSEVIVRLALVTAKAKARVYETGSDVSGK